MIFIPLFCLYTSLHIRKSEDYRLPLWSVFAAGISTALFVLVMTNDVYQAVFHLERKPSGQMISIIIRGDII